MKNYCIGCVLLFTVLTGWSQSRISGVVIDETGMPVPFANVIFVNSSEGTTTSEEGKFLLYSAATQRAVEFSYVGYSTVIVPLESGSDLQMKVILVEEEETLSEVMIYQGKTSKKNNPAIDMLRKIWENRRVNGVKKFEQYEFKKYEKLEFDLNTIDSSVISSRAFKGMEFIFEDLDTNSVTGQSFLPVFLNESVLQVYGDNRTGKKREDLLGNKNSGFNDNQVLIGGIKDLYFDIDVYENYLRIFDKNFVSPLSTTGIDTYNYVLADSAVVDNKWCYQIVYYPRRENELTFKGDFWVNDTTWAIKTMSMEMAPNANINWVNAVFIEQEFDVLNDSVFLLKRDSFMADFSFQKKEQARGIFGKRTVLYDHYRFNTSRPQKFYDQRPVGFDREVYNREETFWKDNRLEPLNENERGVYEMLDTLQTLRSFQRIYRLANIAATGYLEFDGWDFGPVYNLVGYNDVEGLRLRAGARTYFGQNDPWRIEGYGAYGFKDSRFKYGLLGQVMLDQRSRLIVSAGHRYDIEQLGASLTNTTDVLGRSLASSSLLNLGDNDKLSFLRLSTVALEIEPFKNFTFRIVGSRRNISPASPAFSLAWFRDREHNIIATDIDQAEISTMLSITPGRKTTGFGVDRNVINAENFPTIFLNYSLGARTIFNSDFDYKKIQLYYDQPLWIGGLGLARGSLEAGKTFGVVPLGLLSVIPGNQTYFAMYNSFPLLNFYEFVSDTYVSTHFEHNFNGRIFSRIPFIRDLNLREIVGIRGVWGRLSEENKLLDASGFSLMAPSGDPYWEYSVGVGNILKAIRLDAHFRGNYFSNPDARSFGVTMAFGFHF